MTRSQSFLASLKQSLARYQKPALGRSIWQLGNSLIPYFMLLALMVWSMQLSYWITLALAFPAAGFLIRIFIIFHDCGHGSFFRSRRANNFWGFVTGALAFTPFHQWRHEHALHHSSSGDLDRRGTGDIWTLTVQEYLEAPRWKRLVYRVARNPLVLFLIAPLAIFLIWQRFPSKVGGKRERRSVLWTNAALLGVFVLVSFTLGIKTYLLVQLPVLMLASAAGVWLFYVQHQFEGVYWARRPEWEYIDAAVHGSSFYKLPKVLQWFTGNIGFHHIHHLSPAVPNYNLEKCHKDIPVFQHVPALTLGSSLRSMSLRLWDEKRQQLISYAGLRAIRRSSATAASSRPWPS